MPFSQEKDFVGAFSEIVQHRRWIVFSSKQESKDGSQNGGEVNEERSQEKHNIPASQLPLRTIESRYGDI